MPRHPTRLHLLSPYATRAAALGTAAVAARLPVQVSCGALHTVVLTSERLVLTFGNGTCGALGLGGQDIAVSPAVVEELRSHPMSSVAAGDNCTLALEEGAAAALGIARDLDRLRSSATAADCAIHVGGVRFPAHRVVLAARSPRLLAMLQLHERFCTGDFVLRFVKPAIFSLLLRWLYCDRLHVTDAHHHAQVARCARVLRIPLLVRLCRVTAAAFAGLGLVVPAAAPGGGCGGGGGGGGGGGAGEVVQFRRATLGECMLSALSEFRYVHLEPLALHPSVPSTSHRTFCFLLSACVC